MERNVQKECVRACVRACVDESKSECVLWPRVKVSVCV